MQKGYREMLEPARFSQVWFITNNPSMTTMYFWIKKKLFGFLQSSVELLHRQITYIFSNLIQLKSL